ncbi:Exo_endo_phos domain-containing protein, partial [Cephalotus follicularis]
HESWSLLRKIGNQCQLPWLCMGDFNEIMFHWEKEGGTNRANRQLMVFKSVIDDCHLCDMGYSSPTFTWNNGWAGADATRIRLDRCLCNEVFWSAFPSMKILNLITLASDHCPVYMALQNQEEISDGEKVIRLEAMWVREERCGEIIKTICEERDRTIPVIESVVQKLEGCHASWNKAEFGNAGKNIKKIKGRLNYLYTSSNFVERMDEVKHLSSHLNELLERYKIF